MSHKHRSIDELDGLSQSWRECRGIRMVCHWGRRAGSPSCLDVGEGAVDELESLDDDVVVRVSKCV
jgi:hypothetical protein